MESTLAMLNELIRCILFGWEKFLPTSLPTLALFNCSMATWVGWFVPFICLRMWRDATFIFVITLWPWLLNS